MYETDLAVGTPVATVTENGLEIDVTINNFGILGAHQIELAIQVDGGTRWVGVSRNSGWDCIDFSGELRCDRNTLQGQSESGFTIIADAVDASVDDLSFRLVSRTQDADHQNNAYNDEGVEWRTIDTTVFDDTDIQPRDLRSIDPIEVATYDNGSATDTGSASAGSGGSMIDSSIDSELLAANPDSTSTSNTPALASANASAGLVSPVSFLLLATLALMRMFAFRLGSLLRQEG